MPRHKAYKYAKCASVAHRHLEEDMPYIVALDTETTGVDYYDEPFCATLTWRTPDNQLRSAYISFEDQANDLRWTLADMLHQVPLWVGHNVKFDLQKLLLVDALPMQWQEHVIHDTQLIYHLLDENGRKGLKHLAVEVLKEEDTVAVEVKSGPNKGAVRQVPREQYVLRKVRQKLGLKATDGYYHLPREVVIPYAIKDTEYTLRLFETLYPVFCRKAEKDPALMKLYETEGTLMRTLLVMEAHGMGVDTPYVDEMVAQYGVRVMDGLGTVAELAGKDDLNPNSPKQLREVFQEMGEEVDGTSELVLRQVVEAGHNPPAVELAQAVLQLRSDSKVYTTYLKALQRETKEGLWHPQFNQVGARTGRMSSGTASNN